MQEDAVAKKLAELFLLLAQTDSPDPAAPDAQALGECPVCGAFTDGQGHGVAKGWLDQQGLRRKGDPAPVRSPPRAG